MSSDTDYEVLRHILIDHRPKGWAIEFGVYTGQSLRLIAEHMPVIGLDSFEGLPEDWRPGFPKGKFGTQRIIPHVPSNAMIVKGLFSDTLPVLAERGLPPLGLVHIDCDLYSSTVTALEGVKDAIRPGTFVIFDEYHGYEGSEAHEAAAWQEFCRRYVVDANQVAEGPQEAAFVITGMGGSH